MRHDRVFLSRDGWQAVFDAAPALRRDPEMIRWACAGWPLVRRRRLPGEAPDTVPLGIVLPLEAGRRRLALVAPVSAVSAIRPALCLADTQACVPLAWRSTVADCVQAAARHGQPLHVFGSLAWAALTGRAYLTPRSDLDLMLPIMPPAGPGGFLDVLDVLARRAPMRIDGELVRPDGAAMQWRERRSREALVKHESGATLMAPAAFFSGSTA